MLNQSRSHQSYEHDEGSVWQFPLADKKRILQCWTISCDCTKGEDSWQAEVLVSNQQAEDEGQKEGGETAVSVGLGPVEDQEKLWEEDHVGEISTKDTEINDL